MKDVEMSSFERIRGRQLIREAEGYLELLYDGVDLPIRPAVRDQLARRAIRTLRRIESSQTQTAHVQFLLGQALEVMERYADAVVPLSKFQDQPRKVQLDLLDFRILLADP